MVGRNNIKKKLHQEVYNMILNWVPFKQVGPFVFNTKVVDYIVKYKLVLVPDEYNDEVDWSVYSIPDNDMRIFSEKGLITSIALYEECIYNGENIIGVNFKKAVKILSLPSFPEVSDVIEIDNENEKIYEIESLESQIWVRNGIVVTVYCGA